MNAKFVGRVMALTSAFLAMLLPAVLAVAQQEQFPTRPITLIVPFAPGGATDIVARLVAVHVGEDLGQSVVIDNRAGGAGNIGTHAAARANPDGYTLVLATTTQLINQYLSKSLPYNLFTDLVPIALIADAPEVVAISTKLPATTLSEFVAAARADVNGFNYGSAGLGSVPHLGGEVLVRAVSAKMVHIAASHRLSTLPDVPTTAEAGLPGIELSNWFGIMGPRGMSPRLVSLINAAFNKALALPVVRSTLARQGIEPVMETPEQFAARLQADAKSYQKIIEQIGLTPQ